MLGGDAGGEADRHIKEGNRLERDGQFEGAHAAYRAAVAAAPRYAKARLNLGIALQAMNQGDAALAAYEIALHLDPESPYVQYNLANLLVSRDDHLRAATLLQRALECQPEFTDARILLAHVYDLQGKLAEAASELQTVVEQEPGHAGAWHNLAAQLVTLERRPEAEAAARRACEIDPTAIGALQLWANLLRSVGQTEEALHVLHKARALAPERFDLESQELFTLNFSDSASEEEITARHRAFGLRLERSVAPRFFPFENTPDPGRRLRLGYVSGDLNAHPVSWFLIPLLERHDRDAFEIFCYSTNGRIDDVTRQVRDRTDLWLSAYTLSDEALADRIHDDRIDILVDLTGHAGGMQLGVFACRPAPIQVTWLGYLNTTGLSRMDYRLCDHCTDPPGLTEHLHTETLVRLPHSQWCYRPVERFEQVAKPPCFGKGAITFGSFNHSSKLSPAVRRLWAEILLRVPGSSLQLVGLPEGKLRERVLAEFEAAGVVRTRLTLVPRVGLNEYFRQFNEVDIALDTTPYSGGTTTCDTLWMGVPVLTAPGARSVSRSAASILSTVGLTEWIASGPGDYIDRAVSFACDRELLAALRQGLRARIEHSAIMDERGFTRDLEVTYRRLWQDWCGKTRSR